MRMAITRAISSGIARCELTHLTREAIDVDRARRQHAAYEQRLTDAGYSVMRLAADDDIPDSVFIEDIAVVFDELAIVTRPGAASRRAETRGGGRRPPPASTASHHRPARHDRRR